MGAYEVIGGLSALVASAILLSLQRTSSGLQLFLVVPLCLAALLSTVAGVLLWFGYPAGRTISIALQAIFLPRLASPVLSYRFFVGLDLTVGVQHWLVDLPGLPAGARATEFTGSLFFPAWLSVSFLRPSASLGLGLDATALTILILLLLPRFRRSAQVTEAPMERREPAL
ncbi:MAG: hypothetical protein ACR2M1_13040 [Gemmatimonadaceae bacterium]